MFLLLVLSHQCRTVVAMGICSNRIVAEQLAVNPVMVLKTVSHQQGQITVECCNGPLIWEMVGADV